MSDTADESARAEADEASVPAFADGRTLVVALRGWNDAGDAASDAALFLRTQLAESSELLWVCDDEEFFDYSLHRPQVRSLAGGGRRVEWPSVTVTGPSTEAGRGEPLAEDADMRVSGGNRDIFVLTGIEPTLRWRSFADRVLAFIDERNIDRLVLVGSLLNDSPHSRPVTIFASSDDPIVRDELEVQRSEYEGPTGVLGVLADAVRERDDVRVLSLWAAVPHYAHAAPSPKAMGALLDRLEEVLDVSLPHSELLEDVQRWEQEINEMTAADEDIAEYVAVLEQTYDMVEAPEASGEAIAKEFERFLEQSSKPPVGKARPSRPRRLPSEPRRSPETSSEAGPEAEGTDGTPDSAAPDTTAPDSATPDTTAPEAAAPQPSSSDHPAGDAGGDSAQDGAGDAV